MLFRSELFELQKRNQTCLRLELRKAPSQRDSPLPSNIEAFIQEVLNNIVLQF